MPCEPSFRGRLPNRGCAVPSAAHPHVDLSWFVRERGRLEQNLGQRLSRVTRAAASRGTPVSQRGLCNVPRHGARRGQWARGSTLHSRAEATPPGQSGACSRERVHTDTWLGCRGHVRRAVEVEHCCCVKCKCSAGAAPHWHS